MYLPQEENPFRSIGHIKLVNRCARAAITKYHALGGLNNRHLLHTVLEAGSPTSRYQGP